MNLQCPNCQKMLTVPEQYAGQLMKCPLCSNTFAAPALAPAGRANPVPPAVPATPLATKEPPPVSPPAEDIFGLAPQSAPPPVTDSPDIALALPPEVPVPPSPLAAYPHTRTIWISPRVVAWVGPVGLALAFVLSFFPWLNVLAKANQPPQEPGAWGLAFSGHGNTLLVFYLLLLVVAVLLAIAAVVIPRLSIQLPAAVHQIMPWRSGIVGGLTLLAFLFLLLQLVVGLGVNIDDIDGIPQEYRRRTTFWLWLAFLVNLAAAVGITLDFWLAVRKSRPLPRIDVSW